MFFNLKPMLLHVLLLNIMKLAYSLLIDLWPKWHFYTSPTEWPSSLLDSSLNKTSRAFP
jgi:hypothetical protein